MMQRSMMIEQKLNVKRVEGFYYHPKSRTNASCGSKNTKWARKYDKNFRNLNNSKAAELRSRFKRDCTKPVQHPATF